MADSSLTHKFISALADGSDSSQVQPTNWNDSHKITAPDGISTNQQGVLLGTESSGELALNGIVGSGALKYLRRNSGDTAYEFGTLPTLPADGIIQTVGTTPSALSGTASQYLRRNSGNTAYEFGTINQPFTYSVDFNFTPQAPGGNLVIGSNSITLNPKPNGIAIGNYLYISGGTGTAEAVLITGWNSTTGVVIVTCASTHTNVGSNWTIQSATSGIKEAASSINNLGTVILPNGTLNIYKTMVLATTLTLIGQGQGNSGTLISAATGVSPAVVLADANSAIAVGMGGLRDLKITGSGTYGLWIGGDPASVFAPSTWQGNYIRTNNILVQGFTTALVLYQGNFINFHNSAFSTTTPGPTLLVHSLSGGELQPVDFYGCLITSDSGNSVQMDASGFLATPIRYFGGQVSGPITGVNLHWTSFGTHYEPNSGSSVIVNATASNSLVRVSIVGGQVVGLHGAPLDAAFKFGNAVGTNEVFFTLRGAWITVASGTVTDLVNYGVAVGGSLIIADNDIGDGSIFTNLYTIAAATYPKLVVNQPLSVYDAAVVGLAASTTLTFVKKNYPIAQPLVITGGTVGGGITGVAGLTQGQQGVISCLAAQTFTAGATIGNTITLAVGQPYTYYFDGTKIWIK